MNNKSVSTLPVMESNTQTGTNQSGSTVVHILRHGQSLHNVNKPYPHRDPPLTETGRSQAEAIRAGLAVPEIIIISPMTRTIQTTLIAFDSVLQSPEPPKVQIWPELREAHGAICNKGVSRAELARKFPQFDYSGCSEEWDYPEHTVQEAEARAERVRKRIRGLVSEGGYKNIYLVTHRGFIAFLVKGKRFDVCEHRRYQFANVKELGDRDRYGVNVDTGLMQDFGPTVLLPVQDDGGEGESRGE